MNKAQFLAADPKASAWVTASAGTGKTKVLTDRILNLLLQGFAPERILCLTFTKAAASEMVNRLMKRLAQWVTLPSHELNEELYNLLGADSLSPALLTRARHLFTLVLDAPGGMKIQTIHGFCQSILSRFPLEADIPPQFRVLDDHQAEEIVQEALYAVLKKPTALMETALAILNPFMGDQRFQTIINDFFQNRTRITDLLAHHKTFWDYVRNLIHFLEIEAFVQNPEEILDIDLVGRLKRQFVPAEGDFETYVDTYLTKKWEIRKKIPADQQPQAERILRLVRSLSTLEAAQCTVAVLVLFQGIQEVYQKQKIHRCVLDYDDLIIQTQKLLAQPGIASWVMYKLDGGIDHLLIDEAQDTSTAQWEIIQSLTEEFFTSDKSYRTVFVVGDAKQSIYSFQGASPHEFLRLKNHFAQLSQGSGQNWREITLDLSYRSTTAILEIVDDVFASPQNKQGVSFNDEAVVHRAFRENHPGLVELWPLMGPHEEDKEDLYEKWCLPLERVDRITPQSRLANHLADEIEKWLLSKRILPSTRMPIQPRDILILVGKRTVLVQEIIRSLKKRNIPVSGADRLVLTDHIAIMDLLALGQFVLLPEDDLTLACVLRSPLIGMSEDDLFSLAHGRTGPLWASLSLKAKENAVFEEALLWLKACLRQADLSPVYEFYHWVLSEGEGRRRFLSRLGHEPEDVLEEFLAQSLAYDHLHIGSLQEFIHFMSHQSREIRRDTSHTVHNQVRIMTIHGSKGLQAPIVILPDTAESEAGKPDLILWAEDLVMLRPTQLQDTAATRYFKTKASEAEAEERRRLLYVALTRAQDCLYVGGWTSKKDLPDDCWYRILQNTLNLKCGTHYFSQGYHEQISDFVETEPSPTSSVLPAWAYTQPTGAIRKENGLKEKKPLSCAAMERGILIHQFFEFLPQLPQNRRYEAACRIVKKEKLNLSEWEKDIQAVLDILDSSVFREIFGPLGLAEVPVSGVVDGVPFQGRIDRLLVTSDTVTIVDYKTDSNPLLNTVPSAYVKQLESYATALQLIYPNHQMRKLILWTTGPEIQEI